MYISSGALWAPPGGVLVTYNRASAGGSQTSVSTKHQKASPACLLAWKLKSEVLGSPPHLILTYLLHAKYPSIVFLHDPHGRGRYIRVVTSFLGQAYPSWVLVLVHSCQQGMQHHFTSLGFNFLIYEMKLRILDRKSEMPNLVAGNSRESPCGSGWIGAIQLLVGEISCLGY